MALNLVFTGADNEAALLDTLLESEVEELRALVKERGREDAEFLRFCKVETYDQILRGEFENAKWAAKKLSKKGRAE
jgi:hypothetical protein